MYLSSVGAGIAALAVQGAQPLVRSGATQMALASTGQGQASQSAIHTWSQTMYRSAPFVPKGVLEHFDHICFNVIKIIGIFCSRVSVSFKKNPLVSG